MNRKTAIAFGGLFVVAASAAYGQQQNSPVVGPGYVFGNESVSDSATRDELPLPALLTIGGVPVHVWAPVEPHYSSEADRDPAAQSLWTGG
jgi:hypothetical protein